MPHKTVRKTVLKTVRKTVCKTGRKTVRKNDSQRAQRTPLAATLQVGYFDTLLP